MGATKPYREIVCYQAVTNGTMAVLDNSRVAGAIATKDTMTYGRTSVISIDGTVAKVLYGESGKCTVWFLATIELHNTTDDGPGYYVRILRIKAG
jgi:hypothetical protein